LSKANSAVLCLSHELNQLNQLSFDSIQRLEKSFEIFNTHNCKNFITTGWKYKKELKIPLSKIMAEYAVKNFSIHQAAIYEEPLAKDTIGEAYFVKRNFIKANLHINNLIVVTSDWHLTRAKEIFEFIFSEANDPKLYFHKVSGEDICYTKEASNSSILKFREMTKFCKKGNLDDIYSKMLQHHHLYKG
jgi:hypothetical protein